jgi:hypothetical protein
VITLSKAECRIVVQALTEAADYWSVTDQDGVRDNKFNQTRIAKTLAIVKKIKKETT